MSAAAGAGGRPLRVLLVHERYLQRGGEDVAFEGERDLLRAAGHEVVEYVRDNREVASLGRLELALTTAWSWRARAELDALCRRHRPDVAHFHNTLPLISPAAYAAVRRRGVPVVQTLHNYRLVCPGGLLFRGGGPCEDCVGRAVPLAGLRHRCYRGSAAATGALVGMLALHRALGTFARQVDAYVALTRFARDRLVAGGLPAERIHVKPNAVEAAPPGEAAAREGVLFVGRITPEKGVDLLLDAWARLPRPGQLTIVGGGPQAAALRSRAEALGARWLGEVPGARVREELGRAAALALPSRWYEGFPMVVCEAFAGGLPVVAARLGALAELVEDGRTGWLVAPGDPGALAAALQEVLDHPRDARARGEAAREVHARELAPAVNLARLVDIYRLARAAFEARGGRLTT